MATRITHIYTHWLIRTKLYKVNPQQLCPQNDEDCSGLRWLCPSLWALGSLGSLGPRTATSPTATAEQGPLCPLCPHFPKRFCRKLFWTSPWCQVDEVLWYCHEKKEPSSGTKTVQPALAARVLCHTVVEDVPPNMLIHIHVSMSPRYARILLPVPGGPCTWEIRCKSSIQEKSRWKLRRWNNVKHLFNYEKRKIDLHVHIGWLFAPLCCHHPCLKEYERIRHMKRFEDRACIIEETVAADRYIKRHRQKKETTIKERNGRKKWAQLLKDGGKEESHRLKE